MGFKKLVFFLQKEVIKKSFSTKNSCSIRIRTLAKTTNVIYYKSTTGSCPFKGCVFFEKFAFFVLFSAFNESGSGCELSILFLVESSTTSCGYDKGLFENSFFFQRVIRRDSDCC